MSEVVGRGARAPEPALALRAKPAGGLDATRFDQAQVIPGALTVGEVPTWVEIDPAEYVRRREDERASAAHSLAINGSWEAVAAIMMETMVYMAPASHQWGSHHHQLAIVAAGLRDRAEPPTAALEASSRQEERLRDVRPGDRVTIKGEREVYGDGTVTSVEGDCVKVAWDSDPRVMWSFAEHIELLSARAALSPSGERA